MFQILFYVNTAIKFLVLVDSKEWLNLVFKLFKTLKKFENRLNGPKKFEISAKENVKACVPNDVNNAK